jgi:hypothetical protein
VSAGQSHFDARGAGSATTIAVPPQALSLHRPTCTGTLASKCGHRSMRDIEGRETVKLARLTVQIWHVSDSAQMTHTFLPFEFSNSEPVLCRL